MRDAGMVVESFAEHFSSQNTKDHVWLAEIAKRGWIGISKDEEIMASELYVRTTIENGAHLFICIGTHTHEELAENVIRARHKLAQWSHKHRHVGFIARLYKSPEPKAGRRKLKPGEIKAFDHERFLSRCR